VTFVLYGGPVIASGEPTFAGYVKLDDTATSLALTDRALAHGRDLTGLPPSSYRAALDVNLAHGYPLGSLLPLGVGARLVRTDPAWVWQPWIAFAAAVLAAGLFDLSRDLLGSRWTRAAVAFVGADSALLYGFALWGGAKEVLTAALLVLAAATLPDPSGTARGLLVPAVVMTALLSVTSLGGLVWVAPLGLAALTSSRRPRREAGLLALATAVLALPVLVAAWSFLRPANVDVFRSGAELGNLARPLRVWQVLGVWPTGDFRFDPQQRGATWALLALAAAALAVGVTTAVRRPTRRLLVLLGATLVATVVVVAAGSPWLGAKALAVASPVALFTAAYGCALLLGSRRWTTVGALLGSVLAAGVLASSVLAYRAAWLAPYGQLAELQRIGERFAGQGPALMTEYQPYGVRHFLRRLDPEGASELRYRQVRLRSGGRLSKGEYADVDAFRLADLLVYRTLVLRRSPVASQPPSVYRLASRGHWYDVWTREDSRRVLAHLPLGSPLDPLGRPRCAQVRRLAAKASGAGGTLTVPRTPAPLVVPLAGALPAGWRRVSENGRVVPRRAGSLTVEVGVPAPGTYTLWTTGSVRGSLRALIDGRPVGVVGDQINEPAMWNRVGEIRLAAGRHEIALQLTRSGLRPGVTDEGFELGPPALTRRADTRLRIVDPSQAEALCVRRLDWIEAVGR
jgi:hypothetical protein